MRPTASSSRLMPITPESQKISRPHARHVFAPSFFVLFDAQENLSRGHVLNTVKSVGLPRLHEFNSRRKPYNSKDRNVIDDISRIILNSK
jgi:hypothetical protein